MATRTQQQPKDKRAASHPIYLNEGLSPKKTAIIIVTVVACIAILWPKVFYPMMFGAAPVKQQNLKEQRGPGGCCDVVLDREKFLNATPLDFGPQLYRKKLNLMTGEMTLRQERPAHLHPESIYQAMRERGRAIPQTQTVPIVERKTSPSNPPPRIVEGRPGPIPGMRPPMGAGALHQPQPKGSSMGFIMPLYTVGIIVFFGYTIMKLVFKKPVPNAPYGPAPTDPNFRKEVFGQENGRHVEDLNGTKLVVTAIQGLIDAADEQLNSRDNKTTSDNNKQPTTTGSVENISNGHTNTTTTPDEQTAGNSTDAKKEDGEDGAAKDQENEKQSRSEAEESKGQRNKRESSVDRSVTVLGMEITASCEGGQKWSKRPPTPVFLSHSEHSRNIDDFPEPQSIYLEGTLPHESQILVADAETRTEQVYDKELNGSPEEPAVVLSSKMTLSLINLDAANEQNDNENSKSDVESPLADDIEIIGHEEH